MSPVLTDRNRRLRNAVAGLLLTAGLFAAQPARAATCESLREITLPNTTITIAESVAAGALKLPSGGS
ncbi:MAG: hypothetical protein ACKVX9_24275, partial [Blastocatellia bacterium]